MRTHRLTGSIAALAALIIIAAADARPARAQQQRAEETEQRARELFQIGDDHYAAGRYEAAVEHFQRAYELSPQPALLFNMANAYERMGEYQKAADHLRRYLESPRADDVASVRERIRRLELAARAREVDAKEGEADDGQPAAAAGGSTARAASQPEVGVESRPSAPRSRWLPYSLIAAGGLVIGGGVVSAVLSNQAGDDADGECNDDGLCTREARNDLDRQKRFALISDVSIGAGVLCAGAGALLLFLRRDDEKTSLERASLQVTPALGSASLGLEVSGAF